MKINITTDDGVLVDVIHIPDEEIVLESGTRIAQSVFAFEVQTEVVRALRRGVSSS